MNYSTDRSRSSPWHSNEGETVCFSLPVGKLLQIRHGCITREHADGVIVPTNTELIASGAADHVLQTVERGLGESGIQRDVFDVLFGMTIPNPPARTAGSVFIDDLLRDPIGQLGGAALSVPLSSLPIKIAQGWDRVIFAFVRSQSRPPEFEDTLTESTVRSSLQAALRAAADSGVRTVTTVPFGTGLNNIPAEASANYMIPPIIEFLNARSGCGLEKVTIVEQFTGLFESFASAAKKHLGAGRLTL